MDVPKIIGLRIDDQIRAAIADMGVRLGTSNISEIIRVGFTLGYERTSDLQSAITRRAFREGVLAGGGAVKKHIEAAIAAALKEAT